MNVGISKVGFFLSVLLLGLGAATTAQSDTFTQSVEAGYANSGSGWFDPFEGTSDYGSGSVTWSDTLTIPQFDPGWGRLTRITVTLTGSVASTASVSAGWAGLGYAEATLNITSSMTLSWPNAASSLSVAPSGSDTHREYQTWDPEWGLQAASTSASVNVNAEAFATILPAAPDFAQFIGTGNVSFTNTGQADDGFTYNGDTWGHTINAGVGLSVTYEYLPYARFDFNADGKADLLLQNQTTGAITCQFMDGTQKIGETTLPALPSPDWKLVASADFDHDYQNDLLLYNQKTGAVVCRLMNGTQKIRDVIISPWTLLDFRIIGVADLDGDGNVDILFQNQQTGRSVVWLMNGTTFGRAQTLLGGLDTNWKVVAIADFNDDRKPDLLFQNQQTGAIVCWYMDGFTRLGAGVFTTRLDPNWKVAGIGDFNQDRKPDIVFQSKADGRAFCWLLNVLQRTGAANLTPPLGKNWQVAGLR